MSKLEEIIEESDLVPCILTRQINGQALRTESVDGFTLPINQIKVGESLIVYAIALDPEIAAKDGFREIVTSPIKQISPKDSIVTIETENSTYLVIYKQQ